MLTGRPTDRETLIPELRRKCALGRRRDELPDHFKEDLDYMLDHTEDGYSPKIISKALTEHGFPVSKESVATHLTGACLCQR